MKFTSPFLTDLKFVRFVEISAVVKPPDVASTPLNGKINSLPEPVLKFGTGENKAVIIFASNVSEPTSFIASCGALYTLKSSGIVKEPLFAKIAIALTL